MIDSISSKYEILIRCLFRHLQYDLHERIKTCAVLATLFLLSIDVSSAAPQNCVYIFQDEIGSKPEGLVSERQGPEHAIAIANLLGHWPHYEIRVRPIWEYRVGQVEDCHATIYVGTSDQTKIPNDFVSDFFRTKRLVAWLGLGTRNLDPVLMLKEFHHRVGDVISIDKREASIAGYFNRISYKATDFYLELDKRLSLNGSLSTEQYLPIDKYADQHVIAWQISDKINRRIPYFLRADNKFLVAAVPHQDRDTRIDDWPFAFADLLFDILDEKPLRKTPIALGRLEDIHGFYDLASLRSALSAFRAEGVPINIAHIPIFVDPASADVAFHKPRLATESPDMVSILRDVNSDSRNVIVWHGVTHQLGDKPNPNSGISGDDFEFWDQINDRPVPDDSPKWALDRLAMALDVFDAYGQSPRYWETPHYRASALDNVVFGRVFPWVVGGATYYSSSFKGSFTLGVVSILTAQTMPSVTRDVLDEIGTTSFENADRQSAGRFAQVFPFEVYRDVYGERVLPETLGYVTVGSEPRDVDEILGDARRYRVVRDIWGSFFFHPYLLTSKEKGGIGQFPGDNAELRRLIAGLKKLGYRFISLKEFDKQ
jgi:uncharacterized protein YdaL